MKGDRHSLKHAKIKLRKVLGRYGPREFGAWHAMNGGELGDGSVQRVEVAEHGREINEMCGRYQKGRGDLTWLSLSTAAGRDFDFGDPDYAGEYVKSPKKRKMKHKLTFLSSEKTQNRVHLEFYWQKDDCENNHMSNELVEP